MPQILADQQRQSAELGLEGAHAIAAREITLLVEHPVRREIDLAMRMTDLAGLEIDRRVEKSMVRTFFDQAGDERYLATELEKIYHFGRFRRESDAWHGVAQEIAGET